MATNPSFRRSELPRTTLESDIGAISESDVRRQLHRALGLQANASRTQIHNANSSGTVYYSPRRGRGGPTGRSNSSSGSCSSMTSRGSHTHSSRSGGSSDGHDGSGSRSSRSSSPASSSGKARKATAGQQGKRQRTRRSRSRHRQRDRERHHTTSTATAIKGEMRPMAPPHSKHLSNDEEVMVLTARDTNGQQRRRPEQLREASRRASPPTPPLPNSPPTGKGYFVANVFCTRVAAGTDSHGSTPQTPPPPPPTTRFLLSRCSSVPALLTTLQSVAPILRSYPSTIQHSDTDHVASSSSGTRTSTTMPAAATATAASGHADFVFSMEEGNFFVWVDIHGVPPAADDTTSDEAEDTSLSALWRFLQFAPPHIAQMEAVAESFGPRRDTKQARRQRRPTRTAVIASARASGSLSTEGIEMAHHLRNLSNHSSRSVSSSSSSSSSSSPTTGSSGTGGDTSEDDAFHSLAVGDMYLEDLRMVAPDTVQLRKTLHDKGGEREVFYTITEVATLTERQWRKPKLGHHRGAPRRTSDYCYDDWGTFPTSQRSEDERFFHTAESQEDAEVFLDASVPVDFPSPRHATRRKGKGRSAREGTRSRTLSVSSSSTSSTSSSTSSSSSLSSSSNRRQLQGHRGFGSSLPDPPTVTSTYLVAFPNVCVTWCPASSFGRAAAAAIASTGPPSEEPVLTRSVKDWHRLQEAVVARMRGGAGNTAAGPAPTTAQFASLLLATVCYAYLPDTTAVLNEVDSIDAMLPLIVPDRESDQADALRRVLVLRRRLAVHRRLLYQKMRLLEELQRPAMRTLAAFMNEGIGGQHASSTLYGSQPTCSTEDHSSPFTASTLAGTRSTVEQALRKLDGARTTLGNTTLIYASAVTSRNFKSSNDTDFFQLSLQYLCLTVLPLTIVVSQWGLNCMVPWRTDPSLRPFFLIVGVLIALAIAGLAYPIYAMKSGRPELVM